MLKTTLKIKSWKIKKKNNFNGEEEFFFYIFKIPQRIKKGYPALILEISQNTLCIYAGDKITDWKEENYYTDDLLTVISKTVELSINFLDNITEQIKTEFTEDNEGRLHGSPSLSGVDFMFKYIGENDLRYLGIVDLPKGDLNIIKALFEVAK